MPPLERLRSLPDMSRKGATCDMSMLPSTGSLSVEEGRERIHHIEEDMRDICVRMANLEQKLNLATNTLGQVHHLGEEGPLCLPPLGRLRSLIHIGAAFDMSMLPPTGTLS
eukprot:856560-Heterocapsa_arctica.AAC.1